MDTAAEVVIVGGGIGGASLATALARSDVPVVVIEATERFTDRVRGESMMPWGVAEAENLGVADVLRRAGGHVARSWSRYGEGEDEPREIPVGLVVPGVDGTLNLHHPTACQALLDAAAEAGAEVIRGAAGVRLVDDATVVLNRHGRAHGISGRIVVGADGRASTIRHQVGVELERTDATAVIAGLLVEGVEAADDDVVVETGRGMALLLHQSKGRARLYHVVPVADRGRYSGRGGPERLLDELRSAPTELARRVARATPAGPCAAFPNVESWTGRPARGPVVLIGDAAGQSDPSVGCGLSLTLRDARVVRDAILDDADHGFVDYGRHRADLLRRLRRIAALMIASVVTPGEDRALRRRRFNDAVQAMDPTVFPLVLAMFAGPETIPDALLDVGSPAPAGTPGTAS